MEKYAADLVLSMYYTHSRYQKFVKIKMKIDNYPSIMALRKSTPQNCK